MNQPMYSGLHVNQPDTSKEFKSEKEYESRRWAGHKNIRWPAVGWNWAIDVDSHDLLWWIATWILFSSLQSAQSKHKLYIQNEQDTSFWGLSWFVQNLGKQCVGKPPCDRFFFSGARCSAFLRYSGCPTRIQDHPIQAPATWTWWAKTG